MPPLALLSEHLRADLQREPGLPLLSALFARALAPMVITDARGVICHVNPAFEAATGFEARELCGRSPSLLGSRLHSRDFYRRMWRGLRSRGTWQGEIWGRHKSGRSFRTYLSVCALQSGDAGSTHYLGMYAGPGESVTTGSPEVDPVTGVASRSAFLAAADRLHQSGAPVAVLTLDIDDFTELNEHFGLRSGDLLLRQVAMRCQQALAPLGGGVLGRVGSDEFALAWVPVPPPGAAMRAGAPPGAAQTEVQAASDSIRRAVCGTYELGAGRSVGISAQVGVAVLSCGTQRAEEVLLHAAAARLDRSAGPDVVHHYERIDIRRRLVRALREDIMADRLEVSFQPKIDLRTGCLRGLEALARWRGPDGQPVPAPVFIALAEQHGLIAELGDRVFDQVLRHLVRWRQQGLATVPVAINFSAAQFHRHDMVGRIESALVRHAIDASLIEIELTESILLHDFESALQTLQALRRVGVGLSIDDFGTGYSSLAYLRRFPVHRLKIDRSFVQDVDRDTRTREIVEAVIQLAHKFDMQCVAEGVETRSQQQVLQALGCDQAQGYLFARPCSAGELLAMLAGDQPWR